MIGGALKAIMGSKGKAKGKVPGLGGVAGPGISQLLAGKPGGGIGGLLGKLLGHSWLGERGGVRSGPSVAKLASKKKPKVSGIASKT